MVENGLYCLMHCIDRRGEIDILPETSVPHHHFKLDASLGRYRGMVDATIDAIAETVPAEASDELALWTETRGIMDAISRSEEHTSDLQSLKRRQYAVFSFNNKKQ